MKREAKFILNTPKATIPTYIFLKLTCEDGTLKYSTKLKVLPGNWNFDLQTSSDKKINTELNKLYTVVEQHIENCRIMDKLVLVEDVRQELDKSRGRVVKKRESTTIFEYIDILIDMAKSGEIVTNPNKTKYTAGTIKCWTKAKERIFEFDPNLTYESISLDTYNAFIKFCYDRDYSANYTGILIKSLKVFMNLGLLKKWHNNVIHKHPEFTKPKEQVYKVYLNEDEIKKLYDLDLSKNKNLETIRDRFIINLYTGLRISDMKTLSEDHFQDDIITHVNKKTGKKVVIPEHRMVTEILKKYDGKLPYQYHENVVNRQIKEIAFLAGIKEKIRYTRTIGGIKKEFIEPKWQLITTHTCRRSLVSNLLKYVDIIDAKDVMGMSLRTLELYNKRSAEDNAKMLQKNKFFRKG